MFSDDQTQTVVPASKCQCDWCLVQEDPRNVEVCARAVRMVQHLASVLSLDIVAMNGLTMSLL